MDTIQQQQQLLLLCLPDDIMIHYIFQCLTQKEVIGELCLTSKMICDEIRRLYEVIISVYLNDETWGTFWEIIVG
jgi:hypothetical protein